MTKEVQLVGSAREIQDEYIGPERELTVDMSNWDLRIHDGVTKGGFSILNRDNADERYQGRSVELDGLNFTPQQKGILIRRGPADYRLRSLRGNPGQFSIDNPAGTNGDPLITLLPTITTSHTWTQKQTFATIEVQNGIVGDVTGDSYGTHYGPVEGDVTGNLLGNANGNHTGTFTGSVDVSHDTIQFANGQIPLSALGADVIAEITRLSVPIGAILMWSGSIGSIPANWALCDGTNGTSDLRGEFIIGAGGDFAVNQTGGGTAIPLTVTVDAAGSHSHGVTIDGHVLTESEMPAHKHGGGVVDDKTETFNHGSFPAVPSLNRCLKGEGGHGTNEGWSTTVGGGAAHDHSGSTAAAGTHTHTASATAPAFLPPYYAKAFIQKIS